MKARWMLLPFVMVALATPSFALQSDSGQQAPGNPPAARGRRGQGAGAGILGTVTEATADHFTIKTADGETYTVHYSANTRLMKEAPASAGEQGQGGQERMYSRTPPSPIKASDIKVGDAIMARGEVDANARSVGAIVVLQLDPERAKQMFAMEENFGKTWLMGRITAIDGAKVTVEGGPRHASYTFVADENTTFRNGRDPITLADLQVGEAVRVDGAVKDGQFVATTVRAVMVHAMGGPAPRQGPPPQ